MASDIQKLSDKISQLAELTQQLRRENADLRLRAAALSAENEGLSRRMSEARQKVSALMDKYPAPSEAQEAS